MPKLTANYNFDDFYWDFWAFGKYSEEEYKTTCEKYGLSRMPPPDSEIEARKKWLAEKATRKPVIKPSYLKFDLSKLGQCPPNFSKSSKYDT